MDERLLVSITRLAGFVGGDAKAALRAQANMLLAGAEAANPVAGDLESLRTADYRGRLGYRAPGAERRLGLSLTLHTGRGAAGAQGRKSAFRRFADSRPMLFGSGEPAGPVLGK